MPENEVPLGDFVMSSNVTLRDLKSFYDIHVPQLDVSKTLKEVLMENFSDLEVGDRFSLGTIDLIIRKVENGIVSEIGIALNPDVKSKDFFS